MGLIPAFAQCRNLRQLPSNHVPLPPKGPSPMRKLHALGLAVAAAITIACGSGGGSPGPETPAEDKSDPKKDVTVTACKKGEFGSLDITVSIKNSTKEQASYLVTAEGLDEKGTRLGEANGTANAIAGGGTATVKLLGTLDGEGVVKTCRVATATRF